MNIRGVEVYALLECVLTEMLTTTVLARIAWLQGMLYDMLESLEYPHAIVVESTTVNRHSRLDVTFNPGNLSKPSLTNDTRLYIRRSTL